MDDKIGLYIVAKNLQIHLKNYNYTDEEKLSISRALAPLNKICSKCGETRKDIMIFSCFCMLCQRCVKSELLKMNDSLFFNTFEAARKKESMCVCPTHGWRIRIKQLQQIFGSKKLEEYSISAMKRQIVASVKQRNKFPNLCVGCKGVISDAFKDYMSTCFRHKQCTTCFEYSTFL